MKFNVPDMSCGHCTATIEKAITESDSAANVTCDISGHTVSVQSVLSQSALVDVLRAAGYPSTPIAN